MCYTPTYYFTNKDSIENFVSLVKKSSSNVNDRFNEINTEFQKSEKIRIAEEEKQQKIQDAKNKMDADSLQKLLDRLLAIYRSKNWVLWEWSWSYENDYSLAADVSIEVINPFRSKIKYISFTVKAFNAVGDVIREDILGATSKTVRGIGPIEYGDRASYNWERVFYSKVIDKMKIVQIIIQFFDGSKKVITNPIQIHHESTD